MRAFATRRHGHERTLTATVLIDSSDAGNFQTAPAADAGPTGLAESATRHLLGGFTRRPASWPN